MDLEFWAFIFPALKLCRSAMPLHFGANKIKLPKLSEDLRKNYRMQAGAMQSQSRIFPNL
jgi:hypothetical protein